MESTIEKINTPISRKKAAQEKRKQRKRELDRAYYLKNRDTKNARAKQKRQAEKELAKRPSTRCESKLKQAREKAKEKKEINKKSIEAKRAKIREQTRERVRKHREKQKQQNRQIINSQSTKSVSVGFSNRTSKKRATDKVKNALPFTPEKKAAVLEKLVESPRTRKLLATRGVVTTPEEQKDVTALKALATDILQGLSEVKNSGSNENRAAFAAFKSLAFGKTVKKSRAKKSLGKLINLNQKSINNAIKRRESILEGDTPSWLYFKRKVRRDAISEEDAQKVFNFWTHEASRPTGDKQDMMKKRIGKKEYIHHPKHVLEKTQTDAFCEFVKIHPEVKIKQRKFESLKPFFVKQAKERDRRSCLCRKHVEIKIVFNSCMKFRRELIKKSGRDDESLIIQSVTEAADRTLCPKPEGSIYHRIKCLQRECSECGVHKLELLSEEKSGNGTVSWSRYEYVGMGKFLENGQEKKKIALVQKTTPPFDLFTYFKKLLEDYPSHSFMAKWQREQLENLLEHLPLGHVVCIHDYSEGYACRQQDEIQSEYFDLAKVSLHVTILHRHAIEAVDGVASTNESPYIIKEHVFVISDDPLQDHDSVHRCQEMICSYLQENGIALVKMHEFTDGCAAQYKSRHCIGDLSCSLADFGCQFQRNFFETSHAKGEQDAAGSHVKQKVSQVVLNRTAQIKSAESMHKFLTEKFSQPAKSSFTARTNAVQLKRRIFFYVPSKGEGSVARNRPGRKFKEVKGIRKLHCVRSGTEQEKVSVRQRSCYCINCILDEEEQCTNKDWLDEWEEVNVRRDGSVATTRQATEESIINIDTASRMADLAIKGSTVAIAAADDQMYDFYLLKVTSEGAEELDQDFTDDYAFTALRGTRVLKGFFYLRDNIHDMTFTLDKTRTAVVYASTVREICGELPSKKRGRKLIYKLPLKDNEAILSAL